MPTITSAIVKIGAVTLNLILYWNAINECLIMANSKSQILDIFNTKSIYLKILISTKAKSINQCLDLLSQAYIGIYEVI